MYTLDITQIYPISYVQKESKGERGTPSKPNFALELI